MFRRKRKLKLAHHVNANCVSTSYIKDALKYSKAGLKVIILDACRSDEHLPSRGNKNSQLVKEPIYDGMVVAFSTAEGDVALDGIGNNSPYTKNLLKTLEPDHVDGLTLREWFVESARNLGKEVGQKPHRYSDDTLPEYFLKPPQQVKTFTNSIGISFQRIPGGTFQMGSPESENARVKNEFLHSVELSPFYMSTFEITVVQYSQFVKENWLQDFSGKGSERSRRVGLRDQKFC